MTILGGWCEMPISLGFRPGPVIRSTTTWEGAAIRAPSALVTDLSEMTLYSG